MPRRLCMFSNLGEALIHRDERAGVIFNDADLLGMPLRVVVGERGLKNSVVELKKRRASEVETIATEDLVPRVLVHF